MARVAGSWEGNFICGPACAQAWMDEHPIERGENGDVIPRR